MREQAFFGSVQQAAGRDIINYGSTQRHGGKVLHELSSDSLRALRQQHIEATRVLQRHLLLNPPLLFLIVLIPLALFFVLRSLQHLVSGGAMWPMAVLTASLLVVFAWFNVVAGRKTAQLRQQRARIKAIDRVLIDRID